MTVVSIVFSITITALVQTSSHFGPRVLRNFTRDRKNQFVLGTFVATFLFSLMVLRTVRTEDGSAFVPYVSVNIGIALAVLSLAVLIFFIHHIATSIQADLLVARVGEDCKAAVETMFPRTLGAGAAPDEAPLPAWPHGAADPIRSAAVGYVEAIDERALFETACRADVVVRIVRRPGDFVGMDQALAYGRPAGRLDDHLSKRLIDAFGVGARRTPEQDVGYSVQQLVEIAARALSPGVNEPFTAMLCIDWIATALRSLAGREGPPPLRKDASGVVRVIACPLTFVEIVQMSFGMIRRYAGGAADIYSALLRALRDLEPSLHRNSDREALLAEVRQISRDALAVRNPQDRNAVLELAREARDVLRAGHAEPER
jgi:uncharacterized membrane protein